MVPLTSKVHGLTVMLLGTALTLGLGCSSSNGTTPDGGKGGSTGGSAGGTGGSVGGSGGSAGGSGGSAGGTGGSVGGSGGTATGGTDGGGSDARDGGADATADAVVAVDAITGTPDGGAFSRAGWTATSMPPFPTGMTAMNQNLMYANAFDGNVATRWSIGDTHKPIAQVIGDSFTFDMKQPHVFKRIQFWAGAPGGTNNGPDSRDYPGGLDASVSLDCVNFQKVGMGVEPQPGCSGGTNCNLPFTIDLATPATARCVQLTLTKVLQMASGIWWAIDELNVYP